MILLLSVRLLDDRYHGLTANGEKPEWPPSPFRLFQAIVAGNACGTDLPPEVVEALSWLESLDPPDVIAPSARFGQVVLSYVLNNSDGRSRTPKTIRPTLLNGDRVIQYAWKFDPTIQSAFQYAGTVAKAVRHIRAIGWGIDMAIGHGEVLEANLALGKSRIRYFPTDHADTGSDWRLPGPGSLASLQDCYSQYLRRFESHEATYLESGGPIYRLQSYATGEARPHAVFKLLDANEDTYRYPHAKLIHIAGMVRHVAIERMNDDPPSWKRDDPNWLDTFVCGHRGNAEQHEQISYVPLPSIGHQHADAIIRNVMLIAPLGCERELEYVAQRLNGEELTPENQVRSVELENSSHNPKPVFLERFNPPRGKFIAECYLGTSNVWHTVTPVILDGHDDKKPGKTKKLIQTALQRAGIETPCQFTWQAFPFLKNCLSAHKYDRDGRHTGYHRPAHLKNLTAVHVRLKFTHSVPGPITLGAGRHCGFGLMAKEPS
ncbi:MAG: type I-U CRISPR-associated protein Csb2 [Planctomycetota bacterium]|nr:type I-U CRISPR-associated protein Csb2 [Planctomycetota bacterium]